MKVFLSHDEVDRGLADSIGHALADAGDTPISSHFLKSENGSLAEAIAGVAGAADAYVLVISECCRGRLAMCEWRTVLSALWDHPERPLIGVAVGNVRVPPVLEGRQVFRVTDDAGLEEAVAKVVKSIHTSAPSPSQFEEDVIPHVEAIMEKLSHEISKFSLFREDLLKEFEWLCNEMEIALVAHNNSSLLKLQRKISETLLQLTRDGISVDMLEKMASTLPQYCLPLLQNINALTEINFADAHTPSTLNFESLGELNLDKIFSYVNVPWISFIGINNQVEASPSTTFRDSIVEACSRRKHLVDAILAGMPCKITSSDKTGGEIC